MTQQILRTFLFVGFVQGLASCSSLSSTTLTHDAVKSTPPPQVAPRTLEKHESLMERTTGDWVMQGTIDNAEVTNDVYVDRILKGQYVRIHQISREKDAAGEPTYEAWIHIAWDQKNEEYVVMWLDNTGVTDFSADGVGHGKPDGDQIPFIWKLADGSGIHNTFAYERASDTWSWKIDNLDKSGKSSPFGMVTLKRK
jgi:hypothetical protein